MARKANIAADLRIVLMQEMTLSEVEERGYKPIVIGNKTIDIPILKDKSSR